MDIKKNPTKEVFTNIYNRDNDLNKIEFLVIRTIKLALHNPSIAKRFNMTNYEFLKSYILAMSLEDMGDQIKRIAKEFSTKECSKSAFADFKAMITNIEKQYDMSIKSVFNNNIKLSFEAASEKGMLLDKADEFLQKYKKEEWIFNVIDKIRNLVQEVHEISRITYDSVILE